MSPERRERIGNFLAQHGLASGSPDLVAQSLVHRSYAFEHGGGSDNERLEFLGDAVLGCAVAKFLYQAFPDEPEGDLSRKKGFVVSRRSLGRRAKAIGLSDLVLLGKGEELSGGRGRSSIAGSALEALVGALFLEIPFELLEKFIYNHVLLPALAELESEDHVDYKTRLQELVQKASQTVPEYRRMGEEGPAHDRRFRVEVWVDRERLGVGEGARVKVAENRAAKQAWQALASRG